MLEDQNPEILLEQLEADQYPESEAMGMLALAVEQINLELQAGDGYQERIRKWVDKLRNPVRAVARLVKAEDFSISVGFPGGVSVSIHFSVNPAMSVKPGPVTARGDR